MAPTCRGRGRSCGHPRGPVLGRLAEHLPRGGRQPTADAHQGAGAPARREAAGRAQPGRDDGRQPARRPRGSPGPGAHARRGHPPRRRNLRHLAGAEAADRPPGLRVLEGQRRPGPAPRGTARRRGRQCSPGSRSNHRGRAGRVRGPGGRAGRLHRRPRAVQRPGHRSARGCLRRREQLPARPVHEHRQHPRQGEPGTDGGLRRVREAALADHRRIFDALRAHDAHAAERAMLEHLDHVEQGLQPTGGPNGADAAAISARPPASRAQPTAASGRAG